MGGWMVVERSWSAYRGMGPYRSDDEAKLVAETMAREAIGRELTDRDVWTHEGNVWMMIADGVVYHVFPWEEEQEGDGA